MRLTCIQTNARKSCEASLTRRWPDRRIGLRARRSGLLRRATPGECQLHCQTKILERRADLTKRRHNRARRRQQEEFSWVCRTVLQQS